jgi:hypothetical protein
MLVRGRFARRDLDRLLYVQRPAFVLRLAADESAHAEKMSRERDVAVVAMHVEVERVGEGIFLRLEALGRDLLDVLLDVDRYRDEAERAQGFSLQCAHLGADAQPLAVGRAADRPHAVREMAKAVVPESERAKRRVLLELAFEQRAERAVECRHCTRSVAHDERELEHPQLRDGG